MRLTKLTPEYLARRFEENKQLFSGSFYGEPSTLRKGLDDEFEAALNAGLEETIQGVMSAHFNQYIETVRSNVGVQEIVQPKEVIILIGDSVTETATQRTRRDEFSQLVPSVIIATYDRVRRGLSNDLGNRKGTG